MTQFLHQFDLLTEAQSLDVQATNLFTSYQVRDVRIFFSVTHWYHPVGFQYGDKTFPMTQPSQIVVEYLADDAYRRLSLQQIARSEYSLWVSRPQVPWLRVPWLRGILVAVSGS